MDDDDDLFPFLDKLLGEIQYIHMDLARLVEGYQDEVDRMRDRGRLDEEGVSYLRGVPGTKYRVMSEYIRQQWLVLDGEMRKRFPKAVPADEGPAGLSPLA